MAHSLRHVGVHEAKTHLSRLLRDVEDGAEIVVMRAGTPVARIVGVPATSSASDSHGLFEGQFELGDDFDADSAELADLFGVPR
jgi:prevent-host-death family protein